MVNLAIYITDDCETCNRVVLSAQTIIHKFSNVTLQIKNIKELKRGSVIIPAVYINQRLFCYGDFNKVKLTEEIKKEAKK